MRRLALRAHPIGHADRAPLLEALHASGVLVAHTPSAGSAEAVLDELLWLDGSGPFAPEERHPEVPVPP